MSKKRDGVRPMSEENLMLSFERDGVKVMQRMHAGTPAWEQNVSEPWKSKAVEALWVDDEGTAIVERWYKTRNWWVMDREFFRTEGAWACKVSSKLAWIGQGQASRTGRPKVVDVAGTSRGGRDALDDCKKWRIRVYGMVDGAEVEKEWWDEVGSRAEVGSKMKELNATLLAGERLLCVPLLEKGFELDPVCVAMGGYDPKVAARHARTLEKEAKNRVRIEELNKIRDAEVARSRRALKGWATRKKKARGPKRLAVRLMKAGVRKVERKEN